LSYSVDAPKPLSMTIMGNRERLPLAGMAGGLPGATTRFRLKRADATEAQGLACHQDGIRLRNGDTVLCDISNGGGWGDPLNRAPELVLADLRRGLLTEEEARSIFGVIEGSVEEISAVRDQIRRERLAQSEPARRPLSWTEDLRSQAEGVEVPLWPGMLQRGSVAVAERTGAPLALSPYNWTEGCPRLRLQTDSEQVDFIGYLDPISGDLLAVDATPAGYGCSFEVAPKRWRQQQEAPK
jgi:N-methylhydantoinase B